MSSREFLPDFGDNANRRLLNIGGEKELPAKEPAWTMCRIHVFTWDEANQDTWAEFIKNKWRLRNKYHTFIHAWFRSF